uniref:ABC transmembrane type-1 domain-containing protein n=1 Tax=Heterorhabditis bacteriophora TaxID=37862 RepID=A0A1I7WID5_HETBA
MNPYSFQFIAFQLTAVDPSLWPELLRKQYPEAMELLEIPNLYYIPPSSMLEAFYAIDILALSFTVSIYSYLTLKLFVHLISVLAILGLICHMQYIFRKQCEHLTVCTQELQKKFLRSQIIQNGFQNELVLISLLKTIHRLSFVNSQRTVAGPLALVLIPLIICYIRVLDGRLGLQILNDILVIIISTYGSVATIFLIFFNNFVSLQKNVGKTYQCEAVFKKLLENSEKYEQLEDDKNSVLLNAERCQKIQSPLLCNSVFVAGKYLTMILLRYINKTVFLLPSLLTIF